MSILFDRFCQVYFQMKKDRCYTAFLVLLLFLFLISYSAISEKRVSYSAISEKRVLL